MADRQREIDSMAKMQTDKETLRESDRQMTQFYLEWPAGIHYNVGLPPVGALVSRERPDYRIHNGDAFHSQEDIQRSYGKIENPRVSLKLQKATLGLTPLSQKQQSEDFLIP